jgi:hypothetical protein
VTKQASGQDVVACWSGASATSATKRVVAAQPASMGPCPAGPSRTCAAGSPCHAPLQFGRFSPQAGWHRTRLVARPALQPPSASTALIIAATMTPATYAAMVCIVTGSIERRGSSCSANSLFPCSYLATLLLTHYYLATMQSTTGIACVWQLSVISVACISLVSPTTEFLVTLDARIAGVRITNS